MGLVVNKIIHYSAVHARYLQWDGGRERRGRGGGWRERRAGGWREKRGGG